MSLRKLRFLVPSALTLANISAGIFSIVVALDARSVTQMQLAAWAIVAAMIFDLLDGRLARALDAQTEFGAQMDSLTDSISFGVAPAMLMYGWGLRGLGPVGLLFGLFFASCAIVRLARFNVRSNHEQASAYFRGLPTPVAAGGVVSAVLVVAAWTGRATAGEHWYPAVLSVLLGGLMVSGVRFRTFKDVDWGTPTLIAAAVGAAALATVVVLGEPGVALGIGLLGYTAIGVLVGLIDGIRCLLEDRDDGGLAAHDEELLADVGDDDH
ncbi:MAG: CDP-diacylglycerol--serine O-phosphatidyltransferase [Bradymonadaceae bacterium]